MEGYDMELHALACEIADVDGLNYDEALACARRELSAVQHYVDVWDQCAVYLEVLATLERNERPTAAQLHRLLTKDRVVTYVVEQVR